MTEEQFDPELDEVLKAFVRDNRLRQMPAKPRPRFVLLRYLRDRCFPDDRVYSERDVNLALQKWYDDFAAIRRYMIDDKLMVRDHGDYRRGPAR